MGESNAQRKPRKELLSSETQRGEEATKKTLFHKRGMIKDLTETMSARRKNPTQWIVAGKDSRNAGRRKSWPGEMGGKADWKKPRRAKKKLQTLLRGQRRPGSA